MKAKTDLTIELEQLEYEEGSWLKNTESGQAFLSGMPATMRKVVLSIPDEILEMDEEELRDKGRCGINEYGLRMAFWQEYERVLVSKGTEPMYAHRMLRGLMDIGTFRRIIKNPYKTAWILKPVREYMADISFLLIRSRERLWDIINMPIYNSKGVADARTASVVLQAHKQLEDRVLGQTVQKQQQLQVRMTEKNMSPSMSEVKEINGLDDRIKLLETKIKEASSPIKNDET